jgi:hypothetical protein
MATKKGRQLIYLFFPVLFLLFLDSGSRVRAGKKSGFVISILDPQHCTIPSNEDLDRVTQPDPDPHYFWKLDPYPNRDTH